MVSAALKEAVAALSVDERHELAAFLQALDCPPFALTEEQKTLIVSRDAELDANPGLLLSREQAEQAANDILARVRTR